MTISTVMQTAGPLAFQSAYIALQLTALSSSNWLTAQVEGVEYEFSLFRCEDCPATWTQYTPECVLRFACEDGHILCDFASRLSLARDFYLSTAILSLLAALLVTMSQLYKALGYIGEHSKVVYVCLLIEVLGSVLGVVTWFGEAKASFSSKDRLAGNGAELAVAGLGMCVLGAGGLLVNELRFTETEARVEIGNKAYLGLSLRQWLYVKVFPLLGFALALDILSLNSYWVQYRTSILHQGSLLSLDSYLSSNDVAYSCISGPACALDSPALPDIRYCHSFPRLTTAGEAYLWLDGFSLAGLMLWLESALYYALGVEYGIPRLNYSWPLLVLLTKAGGLIVWLAESQADLYATCEASNVSNNLQFCVTDGFVYALWQLFCLTISAAFFTTLYRYRKREAFAPIVPSLSPSITMMSSLEINKPHPSTPFDDSSINSNQDDHTSPGKEPQASVETLGYITVRDVPTAEICVVCGEEKDSGDMRVELQCGHWLHIGCFGRGKLERRTCPKCDPMLSI